MWEAPPPEATCLTPPAVESNGKGKAEVQQSRWDGDGSNRDEVGGIGPRPNIFA
jgi:hypothetical protein